MEEAKNAAPGGQANIPTGGRQDAQVPPLSWQTEVAPALSAALAELLRQYQPAPASESRDATAEPLARPAPAEARPVEERPVEVQFGEVLSVSGEGGSRFTSRKLLVAVSTIAALVGQAALDPNLSPTALTASAVVATAYVLGQALVDAHRTARP